MDGLDGRVWRGRLVRGAFVVRGIGGARCRRLRAVVAMKAFGRADRGDGGGWEVWSGRLLD